MPGAFCFGCYHVCVFDDEAQARAKREPVKPKGRLLGQPLKVEAPAQAEPIELAPPAPEEARPARASGGGGGVGGGPGGGPSWAGVYRPAGRISEGVHAPGAKCRRCQYELTGVLTQVCPECGTDQQTGLTSEQATKEQLKKARVKKVVRRCPVCEYDLTGLTGPHCPECGTVITKLGMARARSVLETKAYWRRLWWIAGGFALGIAGWSVGLYLLSGLDLVEVALLVGASAAGMVIAGVGLIVVWLGWSETYVGTVVKLACIGPVGALTFISLWMGLGGVPLGMFRLMLLAPGPALCVGLLSWLLDMEWEQGVPVTLCGIAFTVAIYVGVVLAMG